jgi:hypothetical protein
MNILSFLWIAAKRQPGRSKEEAQLEKKHELEKRLEDVQGQLGTAALKKTPKKGLCQFYLLSLVHGVSFAGDKSQTGDGGPSRLSDSSSSSDSDTSSDSSDTSSSDSSDSESG